jgi:hypothetical protein
VTRCELGKVYKELRPGLLDTLTWGYGMRREAAEDLIQTMTVKLLENPDFDLMTRPQVEAWYKRRRGLYRWTRDAQKSESARQVRERAWTGPHEKNYHVRALIPEKDTSDSIYIMRSSIAKIPLVSRQGEFTEGVDACIDRLRPPRPRGRPRKNSKLTPTEQTQDQSQTAGRPRDGRFLTTA